MKIAIIEDELPARQHLVELIAKSIDKYHVIFQAGSVKQAIAAFRSIPSPDLIFMDIQLNDGLSLELFDHVEIQAPIVFTTAFDQYMMNAFQQNGIDYLLKPINQEDVERALQKFQNLKDHFTINPDLLSILKDGEVRNFRHRILVKQGNFFSAMSVDQIAYFYSEHKITFLISKSGERFIVDEPLTQLEESLEPGNFFRVNRKYLTSADAIDKFKGDGTGRLEIALTPDPAENVFISQEKAGKFKEWILKSN